MMLPGNPGGEIAESPTLHVKLADEEWRYDNLEEFFAGYRKANTANFDIDWRVSGSLTFSLVLYFINEYTKLEVRAPTREQIEKIFAVFEEAHIASKLPPPKEPDTKPVVFVGHGHSSAWQELKDHLHEKHHYAVETYESGARAGHSIRDIIEEMMSESAFAVLVLTRDDSVGGIKKRARQNVIHETGLFQGRLGYSRAIILLEEGVEKFSNMEGIHYIEFSENNIKETFGEVLATIGREFNIKT